MIAFFLAAYPIEKAPLSPGYETITAHPQDPSLEGVRDLSESQLRFQPYQPSVMMRFDIATETMPPTFKLSCL